MNDEIAMLWYDGTNLAIEEKIRRAACYYQNKYGLPATFCRLKDGKGLPAKVDEIEIEVVGDVLPNHFVIGFAEPSTRLPSDSLLTRSEGREGH